jgi:hypothetical protein
LAVRNVDNPGKKFMEEKILICAILMIVGNQCSAHGATTLMGRI